VNIRKNNVKRKADNAHKKEEYLKKQTLSNRKSSVKRKADREGKKKKC
jgi:hypothetical protein